MERYLVSVIVPVYNVPHKMLRKCLQSLKNQTYKNLEIIVVDDGSTDEKCSIICDEYKDNKKFKIYHKENGGLCDARNFGVNNSSGHWITFVDGDDYLTENCIENVVDKIIDDRLDIVCFGTIKHYKSSKFRYNYNSVFLEEKIYDNNIELLSWLLDFNVNIGDVTAKLYRSSFLKDNNIEHNVKIRQGVEAIDFNIKCFEMCRGLQFVKEYGYNYMYNNNSITLSIGNENIKLLHKGIDQLYIDLINSNYYKELKNKLDTRVVFVIVTTSISGIFSPNNNLKRKEQKELLDFLLSNKNITNAMNSKNLTLDNKRKIIIFLIKNKLYFLLKVVSIIRRIQKERL